MKTRITRTVLIKAFKGAVIAAVGGVLLLTVITRQSLIDDMTQRFFAGKPTLIDQLHLRTLYGSMLVYGYFTYPEATETLYKVLFRTREDLRLDSDFFYNHHDIKEALRLGKTKIMYGASAQWKREHEEYYYPEKIELRLFYAFNPIYLDTENHKAWFAPYQFSTNRSIHTDLDLPGTFFDFRLQDALMH